MVGKKLGLLFGMFAVLLLVGSGLVSAAYYNTPYGGNYGYENYNPSYSYGSGYGAGYSGGYGNRYGNFNYGPKTIYITSSYKDDNGFVYRSGRSSYRQYGDSYSRYNGVSSYDREYVLDRYYPHYSYYTDNSYRESNSPYSYSRHTDTSRIYLGRPEHYVALWSRR